MFKSKLADIKEALDQAQLNLSVSCDSLSFLPTFRLSSNENVQNTDTIPDKIITDVSR